jgi:ankyrin repeat protein
MAVQDLNMMLLCLHWGADPDAIDGNGDTLLMKILKSSDGMNLLTVSSAQALRSLASGHIAIDFIRLLLHFGANPNIQDPQGNNCLHVLAAHTKSVNLFIASLIYEAGGMLLISCGLVCLKRVYHLLVMIVLCI